MQKKPKPYIDKNGDRYYPLLDKNGIRCYNTRQAAQIIGSVTPVTMWRWASKGGVTPFGFNLGVTSRPTTHHKKDALTHRDSHILIPEKKVRALKKILRDAGRKDPTSKPGRWRDSQKAKVIEAANRRRIRLIAPKNG